MRLRMKEARSVPHPISPTTLFGKYFLPSPLMRNPIKGRRGIKRIRFFI